MNKRLKKRLILFFIILITLAFLPVLIFAGYFCAYTGANIWVAATESSISYSVELSGFVNCTTTEPLQLRFPLPYVDAVPALPLDSYSKKYPGWEWSIIQTESGNMLALTSDTLHPENISAYISLRGISYPEMMQAGLIPTGKEMQFLPSSDGRNYLYVSEPIQSSEPVKIRIYYQIHTPKDIPSLLSGRLVMNARCIEGLLPPGNISGYLPADQLNPLPPYQPPHLIAIEPPKGGRIDDFVLSRSGTCVPGYTTHYDYTAGKNTRELRIALSWDNPEYPLRLTLISPDAYILGPYTDSYDLRHDGIIPLNITSLTPLAGEWGIEVSSTADANTQEYEIHVREY